MSIYQDSSLTSATRADPITLAVVQNGLSEIASEMDATLVRTAFSPVISEAQDRASGIYSTNGEVIAQGPTSFPCSLTRCRTR